VDVVGRAEGRLRGRPLEHAQRPTLERHEIVEATAELDGDAALHVDNLRRARSILEHAVFDLQRPVAWTDQQAGRLGDGLTHPRQHLPQLGFVALDGRVVAGFVGSVGEHHEIRSTPSQLIAIRLVIPQQLRASTRAVETQSVHNDAGTLPLHRHAENAYGTCAVGAHLKAVRTVLHMERRVGIGLGVRACADASLPMTVDVHIEGAALGLLEIVEIEHAHLLTNVTTIGRRDATEGPSAIRLHIHTCHAKAVFVSAMSANAMRLPARAVALDLDAALSIAAPWMHGQHEAVAGVAEARLQLAPKIPSVEVTRGVRRAPEEHARLAFASSGALEGRVKMVHRVSVSILDSNGQPERMLLEIRHVEQAPVARRGFHGRAGDGRGRRVRERTGTRCERRLRRAAGAVRDRGLI